MASKAICKVQDCHKPVMCKGWCRSHYYNLRDTASCKAEGCDRRQTAFGYCPSHSAKFRRFGDIASRMTAPGTLLKWIKDNADYNGDACLDWPFGKYSTGYGAIEVEGVSKTAHRLMCAEAHGEPPSEEFESAHACGNGKLGCINPKHLRWATPTENCADRIEHGTQFYAQGELHGQSKVTVVDVIDIRRRKAGGESSNSVGHDYGLSRQAVDDIHHRRNWSHVD